MTINYHTNYRLNRPSAQARRFAALLPAARFGTALFLLGFLPSAQPQERPRSAPEYELVAGEPSGVCRSMVRNLNRFRNEPPQVCFRKVHPTVQDLRLPDWRELPAPLAKAAAEAALTSYSRWQIEEVVKGGNLRVWEADIAIPPEGESARLLLISTGSCDVSDNRSDIDPMIAVVEPTRLQLDQRFKGVSGSGGDVVIFDNKPYLAFWSAVPSAKGSGDPGPKRNHHGYLLLSPIGWLKLGYAGRYETEQAAVGTWDCQIGYKRRASGKGAIKQ